MFITSTNLLFDISKSISALRNSSTKSGISNLLELYPMGNERAAIRRENPVGQLQIEQPIPDAAWHLTRAIDEELRFRLVVQQPVLYGELIVGDTDRVYPRQVKVVDIGRVLALRVMPEDDATAVEPAHQVRTDGSGVTHRRPQVRGSSSGRHRTWDSSP